MADLFVYGTLMTPAVMRAVIGRVPGSEPAELPGYRRHRLRGKVYPAVVPESGATVAGRLYHDLTPAEITRLDRYEDAFYRRQPVTVRDAHGREQQAWCYVLPAQARQRLAARPWRQDAFERTALRRYLRGLRRRAPRP